MNELFRRVARLTSDACGTWQAFVINACGVLLWLGLGVPLHWSDTWQLWCNTFTTVVTYLLVFLVMNTQSRDTSEMRIKLDALLIAVEEAPNRLINLSELTEDQMAAVRQEQTRRAG